MESDDTAGLPLWNYYSNQLLDGSGQPGYKLLKCYHSNYENFSKHIKLDGRA